MNPHLSYESPLSTRNASPAMQEIWSPQRKFSTWRRLWLALAETEMELGLSITREQVDELRRHQTDINFERAAELEKTLRHDVMAHIHALGEVSPLARPIIHLGATSQFVNCNTEIMQIRDGLRLLAGKLANVIDHLGRFAARYRDLPTLGYTHFQAAQPTTVGKRATLWAQELALALEELEHRLGTLRLRGVKGTTGTQASFLELFGGDTPEAHAKCEELERRVAQKLGWPAEKIFVVTGQSYPRTLDGLVIGSLAAVASAAAKMATDLRLLAHLKEVEEPFEAEQVGSSAMPYKRNPMRCERICGLARFVIGLTSVPYTTAAEQWLERTLDDSSTRRLSLPEPFLATDGLVDIAINVTSGLVVYPRKIAANLAAELPFMASEHLLMAAVQKGADRQQVHELIRKHAQAAAQRVKQEGAANDLRDRLRAEPAFQGVDFGDAMDPAKFIGRAPQQVDRFIAEVVEPIRQRYQADLGRKVELKV